MDAEHESPPREDWKESCIFDLDDVFVPDDAEELGEATDEAAAEDDDGYEPDDALGAGDPAGPVVRYRGEDWIEGVPTRDDIVAEQDANGLSAGIRRHMDEGKTVFFMPTDIEETNEYANGYPAYTLKLFGPLMDGSKAEVVVTGIDVFFDVRVPDRPPTTALLSKAGQARLPELEPGRLSAFDTRLRQVLSEADVSGVRVESVEALPLRGYHTEPKPYKRVYTHNLQQRKKAIAAARGAGLETASDDRSSYYRKAAREYGIPLSDWATLRDYEYVTGPTEKSPLCTHLFRVPVESYRPLVDTMAPKAQREKAAAVKARNPLLAKDRTLVLTWDIETHSDRGLGDLPNAANDGDQAFAICMTAHWKDDPTPLKTVCLVDVETAPDSRWTTVICGTPKNVLKAFALVWRGFAPDISTGFNDSNYDWPFVVEKARKLRILGWMVSTMSASPRRSTTDDSAYRWNYSFEKKVKISPEETFLSSYLKVPGCVPIDVRVCYKKLFPKNETQKMGSLKFYLEISGLPSKADMPIARMWHHYEDALETEGEPDARSAENMRHILHYCAIDALRCQQLLVRRNLVNDYREVSSLAFVSLFDSHYYAGGMKVCNLLGAYAWRRGILGSMIPREQEETGKYPGAHVFTPEKGLTPDPGRLAAIDEAAARLRDLLAAEENSVGGASASLRARIADAKAAVAKALADFAHDRPVTGLDASSLYPSLIMTYNLSPEKILLTAEEAAHWRAQGLTLHPIEFPFNGRTVRGWSIRHGNVPEDIGLYPSVLIDLFNKRAEVKVVLGVHGAVKELIEIITGRAKKDGVHVAEAVRRVLVEAEAEKLRTDEALGPDAPPPRISPGATLAEEVADLKRLNRNAREQVVGIGNLYALARKAAGELDGEGAEPSDDDLRAAVLAEYDRACFDWTCANTKQNALKVYMNTFYGEAGNSLSAFFLLQLAGGVTSAGQYNIKLIADEVRRKGFHIKYGDTDSLYLVPPDKYFADCDAEYVAGRLSREEWWSAMVRITMRALNQIRDEVNVFLRADNGTGYLKMAYEEVLYPVVFTGKKKYFGIPHLNEVNFRPKKLFVKGIDVVKQGQSGLAREIGNRIMWACMALDNRRDVRKITEDVLHDAVVNGAQWKFDHFVKTDTWKPNKDNKPVQRFIARMKARHALEVREAERAVAAGQPPKPYLYEIPEAGERFSYVIAKTGAAFNLRGCKAAMKKGDRMEFARAARALNLEVDVAFYMINYIVGLCARFINGNPEFAPKPTPQLTEKKADELSQKAAKRALEIYIKGLSNLDSGMLRKRGVAYRRAFGQAALATRDALVDAVGAGAAEVLHGEWLDFELFGDEDEDEEGDSTTKSVDTLWKMAGLLADQAAARDAADWNETVARSIGIEPNGSDSGAAVAAKPPTPVARAPVAKGPAAKGPAAKPSAAAAKAKPPATRLFAANVAPRGNRRRPEAATFAACLASCLDRQEAAIRTEIAAHIPTVADVAVRYEADLSRLVHHLRLDEHSANEAIGAPESGAEAHAAGADFDRALVGVTAADTEALLAFRRTWFAAVGVQLTRRRNLGFAAHLARLRNKRLGTVTAPSRADREKTIAAAAAKLRPLVGVGDL
jgi:DNA polymerase elongation subunit (family B)